MQKEDQTKILTPKTKIVIVLGFGIAVGLFIGRSIYNIDLETVPIPALVKIQPVVAIRMLDKDGDIIDTQRLKIGQKQILDSKDMRNADLRFLIEFEKNR